MIFGVAGVDPERRQQLIHLLDINLNWRLNRVSHGQRRRVQICMGLLKPYQVSAGPSEALLPTFLVTAH
jgi:CCR4-NOT complex subunit CAF16